MTATTQPGITLRQQIKWFEELVKYNHRHGFDQATIDAILASLIRLREIEGKLREPSEEMQIAGVLAAGNNNAAGYIVGIYRAMSALLLRGKP